MKDERGLRQSMSAGDGFTDRGKAAASLRLSEPDKRALGSRHSRAGCLQSGVRDLSSIVLIGETAQGREHLERGL